jgi:hypothetical protein
MLTGFELDAFGDSVRTFASVFSCLNLKNQLFFVDCLQTSPEIIFNVLFVCRHTGDVDAKAYKVT